MRTEPDVSVWIDEDGDFRGLSPNSGWPRTGARMTGFFCAPQVSFRSIPPSVPPLSLTR